MRAATERAIAAAGGASSLASRIGERPNVVGNWKLRGQVPAEKVIAVEAAISGAVSRYELRADVFGPDPAAKPAKRSAAA